MRLFRGRRRFRQLHRVEGADRRGWTLGRGGRRPATGPGHQPHGDDERDHENRADKDDSLHGTPSWQSRVDQAEAVTGSRNRWEITVVTPSPLIVTP